MRLVPSVVLALAAIAPVRAGTLNMPGDMVGDWLGSCTQVETGVKTNVIGTFQQQSDVLILGSWRTDGPLFGCPAADPGGYPLFKGAKKDGWSAHAFHINGKDNLEPWGKMKIHSAGTNVIVKGSKACNGLGPKSYKGKGVIADRTFTINLKGKIQGEVANYTCTWTKFF